MFCCHTIASNRFRLASVLTTIAYLIKITHSERSICEQLLPVIQGQFG